MRGESYVLATGLLATALVWITGPADLGGALTALLAGLGAGLACYVGETFPAPAAPEGDEPRPP